MSNGHGRPIVNKPAVYKTELGAAFCGDSLQLLAELPDESVQLVITSPPFALQRQKEYGNETQDRYVDWLLQFAAMVFRKLRPDGSFVIDIGGAYEKGVPSRSLYPFRFAIRACDELGFKLAEDFYWFNPSKLPSPIEWVNKRKIRAKDSVNTVSKVLAEYSDRMKKLLEDPEAFYSPKKRPSGHDISSRFGKDNGGSIPSNLLQIPNSESNGQYLRGCKALDLQGHPARFPAKLPEFFIRFLSDPGDLVLDIFAGSNTSGAVAEVEGRRWLAFDLELDYLAASAFRFMQPNTPDEQLRALHTAIMGGQAVELRDYLMQKPLFV
jgi:site-specific DNA-methyltransferase (cytosine-N4-specific)